MTPHRVINKAIQTATVNDEAGQRRKAGIRLRIWRPKGLGSSTLPVRTRNQFSGLRRAFPSPSFCSGLSNVTVFLACLANIALARDVVPIEHRARVLCSLVCIATRPGARQRAPGCGWPSGGGVSYFAQITAVSQASIQLPTDHDSPDSLRRWCAPQLHEAGAPGCRARTRS